MFYEIKAKETVHIMPDKFSESERRPESGCIQREIWIHLQEKYANKVCFYI